MKKLFLTLGIAALFMTACNNNNTPAETEAPAEDTVVVEEPAKVCPMAELKCGFENWANMTEEEQKAIVEKAIALFGAEKEGCCNHEGEEAHQCNHEGEEAHQCKNECKEGHQCEMTEEMKAMMEKMNEWNAQFANIATMTLEEQKALIMARFEMMEPCCKKAAEAMQEEAAEAIQEVVAE